MKLFKRILITSLAVFIVLPILLSDLLRVKDSLAANLNLPEPGQYLAISEKYSGATLRGLKLNPDEPLKIDFIFDSFDQNKPNQEQIKRSIEYFLAALATDEKNLWVNLSPYEPDRIVEHDLSETELGKTLLSQDYLLKQFSTSLTSPETELGAEYWKKLESKSDSYSKVWVVPDKAKIYTQETSAYVTLASLDVKVEADYLANQKNITTDQSSIQMRELIIPKIKEEVNHGKHFSQLRQMYSALILAKWFKQKFEQSFFKHYINSNKLEQVSLKDKDLKEKVFKLYVQAFKKGTYDLIKKETNQEGKLVKRHYFAGGNDFTAIELVDSEINDVKAVGQTFLVSSSLSPQQLNNGFLIIPADEYKKDVWDKLLKEFNFDSINSEYDAYLKLGQQHQYLNDKLNAFKDVLNYGKLFKRAISQIPNYPLAEGGFATVAKFTYNNKDYVLRRETLDLNDPASAAKIFAGLRAFMIQKELGDFDSAPSVFNIDVQITGDYVTMEQISSFGGYNYKQVRSRSSEYTQVHGLKHMLDVAIGLDYLHQRKLVFADLKEVNIVVGTDGKVRIIDFDMTKYKGYLAYNHKTGKFLGTPYILDPVLAKRSMARPENDVYFDTASDVFAFGLLIYYALTGDRLYGLGATDIPARKSFDQVKAKLANVNNKRVRKLIEEMLNSEVSLRPSMNEVQRVLRMVVNPKTKSEIKIHLLEIKNTIKEFRAQLNKINKDLAAISNPNSSLYQDLSEKKSKAVQSIANMEKAKNELLEEKKYIASSSALEILNSNDSAKITEFIFADEDAFYNVASFKGLNVKLGSASVKGKMLVKLGPDHRFTWQVLSADELDGTKYEVVLRDYIVEADKKIINLDIVSAGGKTITKSFELDINSKRSKKGRNNPSEVLKYFKPSLRKEIVELSDYDGSKMFKSKSEFKDLLTGTNEVDLTDKVIAKTTRKGVLRLSFDGKRYDRSILKSDEVDEGVDRSGWYWRVNKQYMQDGLIVLETQFEKEGFDSFPKTFYIRKQSQNNVSQHSNEVRLLDKSDMNGLDVSNAQIKNAKLKFNNFLLELSNQDFSGQIVATTSGRGFLSFNYGEDRYTKQVLQPKDLIGEATADGWHLNVLKQHVHGGVVKLECRLLKKDHEPIAKDLFLIDGIYASLPNTGVKVNRIFTLSEMNNFVEGDLNSVSIAINIDDLQNYLRARDTLQKFKKLLENDEVFDFSGLIMGQTQVNGLFKFDYGVDVYYKRVLLESDLPNVNSGLGGWKWSVKRQYGDDGVIVFETEFSKKGYKSITKNFYVKTDVTYKLTKTGTIISRLLDDNDIADLDAYGVLRNEIYDNKYQLRSMMVTGDYTDLRGRIVALTMQNGIIEFVDKQDLELTYDKVMLKSDDVDAQVDRGGWALRVLDQQFESSMQILKCRFEKKGQPHVFKTFYMTDSMFKQFPSSDYTIRRLLDNEELDEYKKHIGDKEFAKYEKNGKNILSSLLKPSIDINSSFLQKLILEGKEYYVGKTVEGGKIALYDQIQKKYLYIPIMENVNDLESDGWSVYLKYEVYGLTNVLLNLRLVKSGYGNQNKKLLIDYSFVRDDIQQRINDISPMASKMITQESKYQQLLADISKIDEIEQLLPLSQHLVDRKGNSLKLEVLEHQNNYFLSLKSTVAKRTKFKALTIAKNDSVIRYIQNGDGKMTNFFNQAKKALAQNFQKINISGITYAEYLTHVLYFEKQFHQNRERYGLFDAIDMVMQEAEKKFKIKLNLAAALKIYLGKDIIQIERYAYRLHKALSGYIGNKHIESLNTISEGVNDYSAFKEFLTEVLAAFSMAVESNNSYKLMHDAQGNVDVLGVQNYFNHVKEKYKIDYFNFVNFAYLYNFYRGGGIDNVMLFSLEALGSELNFSMVKTFNDYLRKGYSHYDAYVDVMAQFTLRVAYKYERNSYLAVKDDIYHRDHVDIVALNEYMGYFKERYKLYGFNVATFFQFILKAGNVTNEKYLFWNRVFESEVEVLTETGNTIYEIYYDFHSELEGNHFLAYKATLEFLKENEFGVGPLDLYSVMRVEGYFSFDTYIYSTLIRYYNFWKDNGLDVLDEFDEITEQLLTYSNQIDTDKATKEIVDQLHERIKYAESNANPKSVNEYIYDASKAKKHLKYILAAANKISERFKEDFDYDTALIFSESEVEHGFDTTNHSIKELYAKGLLDKIEYSIALAVLSGDLDVNNQNAIAELMSELEANIEKYADTMSKLGSLLYGRQSESYEKEFDDYSYDDEDYDDETYFEYDEASFISSAIEVEKNVYDLLQSKKMPYSQKLKIIRKYIYDSGMVKLAKKEAFANMQQGDKFVMYYEDDSAHLRVTMGAVLISPGIQGRYAFFYQDHKNKVQHVNLKAIKEVYVLPGKNTLIASKKSHIFSIGDEVIINTASHSDMVRLEQGKVTKFGENRSGKRYMLVEIENAKSESRILKHIMFVDSMDLLNGLVAKDEVLQTKPFTVKEPWLEDIVAGQISTEFTILEFLKQNFSNLKREPFDKSYNEIFSAALDFANGLNDLDLVAALNDLNYYYENSVYTVNPKALELAVEESFSEGLRTVLQYDVLRFVIGLPLVSDELSSSSVLKKGGVDFSGLKIEANNNDILSNINFDFENFSGFRFSVEAINRVSDIKSLLNN